MTPQTTDYYQGPHQPVIQVKREEKNDWIVWNWIAIQWDRKPHRCTDGESAGGKP